MLGDLFGVESLLLVSLLALDSRQVLFVAPVLWLPTLVWKNDDERVHMGTKRVSLRLRAVLLVTFFLIATSVILGTLLARQSNDALKTLRSFLGVLKETGSGQGDGSVRQDIRYAVSLREEHRP